MSQNGRVGSNLFEQHIVRMNSHLLPPSNPHQFGQYTGFLRTRRGIFFVGVK